jgi:hypothetical protein
VEDFEKLGTFYLGREYDLATKATGNLLLYDSKDLVTHGVCVGMTGSGKTGLCVGLLEEAALDGIPAIVVDPKGDLGNLLLTFPDLQPSDFQPWVDPEEAARQGLTPGDFAKQQADVWKQGLAQWGEDGGRIARLKAAADFTIYTPGSNAGLPVSILRSLSAPAPAVQADDEALGDRVSTAVTSLLGLLGIEADPIQSREHILLSRLFAQAWSAGLDLSLASVIQQIQKPPFETVGVLDLESFYPAKDRFDLAMRVNNLLAAPGFQTWLGGEPLDIGRMLFTPEGKARVSIFSIAHLSEAERMFFVSMLLNEVLGWVRAQPGTGSLRAIVYMDEIFGFFPPVANPPSKQPLLTLLKQARAFGVGILLATQNPVDLDYKGLANAGTWFIGRLQTENDKNRLLEGLEGVAAGTEEGFDRQKMGETLAGLGKRVFLMYNVHEAAPVTFQSRWTMSYLAGPLTRAQIKTLMDPRRPAAAMAGAPSGTAPSATATIPMAPTGPLTPVEASNAAAQPADTGAPDLPAEIPQFYLPLRGAIPQDAGLVYRPGVLAAGTVNFVNPTSGASTSLKVRRIAPAPETSLAVDWDAATTLDPLLEDLDRQPYRDAGFAALPPAMSKLSSYRSWGADFSSWAFRTQSIELFRSSDYKMTSNPGETEGEFRARLQLAARETRDETKEKLRKKYDGKIATLQAQEMRAEQAVGREAEQAKARKMQTAISLGSTVLGAFLGRKAISTGTLGRATTTMRDVSRSMDEAGDVQRAQQNLEATKQKLADLQAEFQAELDALEGGDDPSSVALAKVLVRPRKSDISVDSLGLVWMPFWENQDGSTTKAWE